MSKHAEAPPAAQMQDIADRWSKMFGERGLSKSILMLDEWPDTPVSPKDKQKLNTLLERKWKEGE